MIMLMLHLLPLNSPAHEVSLQVQMIFHAVVVANFNFPQLIKTSVCDLKNAKSTKEKKRHGENTFFFLFASTVHPLIKSQLESLRRRRNRENANLLKQIIVYVFFFLQLLL